MAVKKTTPKAKASAAKSSVKTVKSLEVNEVVKNAQPTKPNKLYVVLAVVILLLGLGLYFGRGLFVAAVVNGQPISRLEVVRETEKQKGKDTLSTLVRNTLVEQEAQKQKVIVSDKEVEDEIKKYEQTMAKQGQKLDEVLAMQQMTRSDLQRLVRLNKLVTKIVGKDVVVTDKEVDAYIVKNKDLFPEGQDEAKLKKDTKEGLMQEKISEKIKAWLADLEKKAKVIYFVQY